MTAPLILSTGDIESIQHGVRGEQGDAAQSRTIAEEPQQHGFGALSMFNSLCSLSLGMLNIGEKWRASLAYSKQLKDLINIDMTQPK